MDWQALQLSLLLAALTSAILLPIGLILSRGLAHQHFTGKYFIEALIVLPLVLPPTVLGYFLLTLMDQDALMGYWFYRLTGSQLAFSFNGLLMASLIYSLPFAVQPMLRALEQIPYSLREAAWCSGLSRWQTFFKIELPLAWPGIVTGLVLSFCHTLGEFGVVLMIGGNIAGETRTLSIAIYDSVLAFDHAAAQQMSIILLLIALVTVTLVYRFNRRLMQL